MRISDWSSDVCSSDLHTAKSEDEETDCAPILDQLEENLPKVNGRPYLSSFALTHPDKDHIQGFEELMERVDIGELWFTPRVFREQAAELCEDAAAFREEDRKSTRLNSSH